MGCDIHLHAEARIPVVSFPPAGIQQQQPTIHFRWRPISQSTTVDLGIEGKRIIEQDWYPGRNYLEFSILAGVRNYHNLVPISPPRDLPHDVSYEVGEEYERWGMDAHSTSWLTLDDLLADPGYWAQKIPDDEVEPDEWITYRDASSRIQYIITRLNELQVTIRHRLVSRYVHYVWDEANLVGYAKMPEEDLPDDELENLKPDKYQFTENDLRIVFWFDN